MNLVDFIKDTKDKVSDTYDYLNERVVRVFIGFIIKLELVSL